MGKPAVSIIIPVYNMEKYILNCLESVLNQTFEDIEIIVINDGSVDNSLGIINEYAGRDERIIVINQENRGLSHSRNQGILAAKGRYLSFIDSDDTVKKDFIEKMFYRCQEDGSDIVVCNYIEVYEGTKKLKYNSFFESKSLDRLDAMRELIRDYSIKSFVWNKLFSKTIFDSNNILFKEGVLYEDLYTTYKLFFYANRVSFLDDYLYYYLQREGSITNSISARHIEYRMNALEEIKWFLIENRLFDCLKREFVSMCLLAYLDISNRMIKFDPENTLENKVREKINALLGGNISLHMIYSMSELPVKKNIQLTALIHMKSLYQMLYKLILQGC
ncbi:MAG: glycosyltransferase family 2 protein [Acetivibrionales bacterium]|jgi:glycosyltransferase involved in cell wall biosynthesis